MNALQHAPRSPETRPAKLVRPGCAHKRPFGTTNSALLFLSNDYIGIIAGSYRDCLGVLSSCAVIQGNPFEVLILHTLAFWSDKGLNRCFAMTQIPPQNWKGSRT